MIKPDDPRQLAADILKRSTCSVKVGAVIADYHGIFSWGWNNVGGGFGKHAECHAIERAGHVRLYNATIFVASVRGDHGKTITSKPCEDCQKLIASYTMKVVWRNRDGEWIYE